MSAGTLVLSGALIFAAIIGIILLRSNHRYDLAASDNFAGDPLAINPGNAISINGGEDWLWVCGDLIVESSHTWTRHTLDDTIPRWICVEGVGDKITITLWTSVPSVFVQADRGNVIYNGVTYTLEHHGRGRYSSIGATQPPSAGEVEYMNFEGEAQGKAVFFSSERFDDGDWVHSVGHILPEQLLITNPPVT